MKTTVAMVKANHQSIQVNILLDEGAQCSFITQNIADNLQLTPHRRECVAIATFGGSEASTQTLPVATIYLQTIEATDIPLSVLITQSIADHLQLTPHRRECVAIATFGGSEASTQTLPVATIYLQTIEATDIPLSVLITPKIAQPLCNLPFSYVKELPYLKDLCLNHATSYNRDINISMLIGADAYWSIVQNTVVQGPSPVAVQSKLGYLLSGPLYGHTTTSMPSGVYHFSSVSLHDSPDITPSGEVWEADFVTTNQSSTFLQDYIRDSVTRQNDGTYLVKFPWKPDHPVLPTNKSTCEQRVWSLVRKLNTTPDMLKIYNRIIEEQLVSDFIEKVPESELNNPCHYIPHHGVHKDSVTTPLRIVYDCSSRDAKYLAGLNDCLETGPLENSCYPPLLLY